MISGTIRATCPGCGLARDCALVQTIDASNKDRLLAGELNVLACERCGQRTTLEARVLYRDGDYSCQVVPGGDAAMEEAAVAFAASGIGGVQRLVPSLNALVEKVKLRDAGLDDRAAEMTKVLLLASLGDGELGRVLLFHARENDRLHWLFVDEGSQGRIMASPLASYERLAARLADRADTELRVDRKWAIDEVRAMIAGAS